MKIWSNERPITVAMGVLQLRREPLISHSVKMFLTSLGTFSHRSLCSKGLLSFDSPCRIENTKI